ARHQENLNALEIARRKLLGLGAEEAAVEQLRYAGLSAPLRGLAITSPLSGIVANTESQVGNVVEPVQHLFEIVDLTTVWAKIEVLSKDLPRIEVGLPVVLRLTAYPGQEHVFRTTVQAKGLA